jgi:2-methylcitrate dehydratase PrpD
MSKQLHAGKAAADGLLSAYLARDGFTGASRILEGQAGMGAAMSRDADLSRLTAGLTERPLRWKVLETSLKYHASCRHTHPAADALLEVMRRYNLSADGLAAIRVRVYRAASDVLGAVDEPRTLHQAKFSLGFVLALIALYGHAGVADFTQETLHAPAVTALARRVSMVVDDSLDALYPSRWGAIVDVETADGRVYSARVDEPKGDPGNPLTEAEVEEKFRVLALSGGLLGEHDVEEVIARVRTLERAGSLRDILPGTVA